MEFLRGLFTALLLDILAYDCCIALTVTDCVIM